MRLYLQLKADPNEPPRFCQLVLQQDLLGGWTLVRESGRQGSRGTVKQTQHADRDSAQAALIAERDRLLAKGYRVMFGTSAGSDRRIG